MTKWTDEDYQRIQKMTAAVMDIGDARVAAAIVDRLWRHLNAEFAGWETRPEAEWTVEILGFMEEIIFGTER